MASNSCLRPSDYTVAWISALPLELSAARQMLDSTHCPLEQSRTDTNIYTYGSIGDHNVILACLPAGQIGNISAAAVATEIRARFPSVEYCLLIGIGGGVPSKQLDLRLGDVVVGQPVKGRGGVVQYDFGKSTPSGFQRTGSLDSPPSILLSAISGIQASNDDPKGGSSSHLLLIPHSRFLPKPPTVRDILFQANYEHVGDSNCDQCDKTKVETRLSTAKRKPMVHYGGIASGNQVIKDARTRDRLSQELDGILCFEMEAAGVMKSLPCLVIRGICGKVFPVICPFVVLIFVDIP
jgi:nucleoside phosphorylase